MGLLKISSDARLGKHMAKSRKLETALDRAKEIQRLETLADRDVAALRSIIQSKQAIAFLLSLLARGNAQDARNALIALDIYRHTTKVWQQVTEVAQLRDDASLITMFNRDS